MLPRKGVKVDDDEALRWLRLSAEQGDAGANTTSLMYPGRCQLTALRRPSGFEKQPSKGTSAARPIRASEAAGLLETDQWE